MEGDFMRRTAVMADLRHSSVDVVNYATAANFVEVRRGGQTVGWLICAADFEEYVRPRLRAELLEEEKGDWPTPKEADRVLVRHRAVGDFSIWGEEMARIGKALWGLHWRDGVARVTGTSVSAVRSWETRAGDGRGAGKMGIPRKAARALKEAAAAAGLDWRDMTWKRTG